MKKKLFFEQLESRLALAPIAACFVEPVSYDVNFDGLVTPADVLSVVQHINNEHGHNPFFDVDCNQQVAPLDALLIVNHINKFGVASPAAYPQLSIGAAPGVVQQGVHEWLGKLDFQVQGNRTISVSFTVIAWVDSDYSPDMPVEINGLELARTRETPSAKIYTFFGVLERWGTLEVFVDTTKVSGKRIGITLIRTEWNQFLRVPFSSGISLEAKLG